MRVRAPGSEEVEWEDSDPGEQSGEQSPGGGKPGQADSGAQVADVLTRWLLNECGLALPSVIISLTGGAQDFTMKPALQASLVTAG